MWRSGLTDVTDILAVVWAILVTAAPLVLVAIVAFVLGRWYEKKDRRAEDDRDRIYEPLYAQVLKLVSSEESAKMGFGLNTPDTLVLDDIVSHGLLVPPRHGALKEDMEKLKALTLTYNSRAMAFSVAMNEALVAEGERHRLDALKSDSALSNAVAGLSKEAFVKRIDEILRGIHESKSVNGEAMFRAVTAVLEGARALRREATDELLRHAKMMQAGLESAIMRGKYRRGI